MLVVGFLAARAQAPDGMLSEREVESLRDSAYMPLDRVQAYQKILETREKRLDDLLKQRKHTTFNEDVHDVLDQFGALADELNDNLESLDKQHRDLRKVLPKLIQ